MKKFKLFISVASVATIITPISLLSLSCKADYEKTKLLDHPNNKEGGFNSLPLENYSKVGRLLDKKVTKKVKSDKKDPITGLPILKEYTETYWDWFHSMEGEITNVVDGDTVDVKITKVPKKIGDSDFSFKEGEVIRLRIPTIDTFEEHLPGGKEIDPIEKQYALRDHAFAESLIPVGTKVRMVSSNWINKTYDRYVADLFFGENFERNFSMEMLSNGYTLPRLTWDGEYLASFRKNYNKKNKEIFTDLTLPYLAYAFNDGIAKKRGFYEKDFKDPYVFSSHYKTHGDLIGENEGILSSKFSKYSKTHKNQLFKWIQNMNKKLIQKKIEWKE